MNGSKSQRDSPIREGLFVRLFGGPVLLRDGVEVALSAYQSHLLALIYGSGSDGISREEAAWLLWESEDSPKARHRLSQLLYGMRARLGQPVIRHTDAQLLRGSLVNDLDEVLGAMKARALPKELAVGGAYLATLEPPTVEMGHWLDARRATMNSQIRESLQHTILNARASADWARVRNASRMLVTIDGANEKALESLIEAMTLGGEAHAVAAEVSGFATRYRARTGCEWRPSETLRTTMQRAERFGEIPTKTVAAPFIGRSAELQQLMKVLTARPSKPVFTILCGEAGIGKTRLASEALKQLVLKAYTTFECKASLLRRDIPLSSVLTAFSHPSVLPLIHQLEEPWRSSITRLLPQLQEPDDALPIPLDPESAARRLMESLYQVLSVASSTAPTLLFLDDAQWMDVTTLTLLEFIADRSPAVGIHILIGLRDEAVNEHVRSFIEFSRDRGHWIRLGPLDDASADLLLEATANRPLRTVEKERLRATSGQNPFFLLELANDYLIQPASQQDEQAVPESIRQLVAVRLELLSAGARTLLQYLTIVDSVDVLAPPAIKPLSSTEFVDAADDLLRARMIHHQGGTISIQHDLIRHAVYELMGPVKRAVLHIQAAEEAHASPGTAAIHYDRAGIRDRAFEAGMQAGEAAQAAGAVHEAVQFYEIARRNAETRAERRSSTEALGALLYESRRLDRAIDVLSEAVELSASPDQLRLMLLDAQSEMPGAQQENYLDDVDRVRSNTKGSENWGLYATAVEVRLRMLQRANRIEDIHHQLTEVHTVLNSLIDPTPDIACGLNLILAISQFYAQDGNGLEAATTATRLAEEHGIHSKLLRAFSRLTLCYLCRGELHSPRGVETIRAALSYAAKSGDVRSRAMIHNNVGAYYMDTRQFSEAYRLFKAAFEIPSGPSERATLLVNWAEWHYWTGNLDVALESFQEALLQAKLQPVFPIISAQTAAGLGLCALARGALSQAEQFETEVRAALLTWVHDRMLLVKFLAELNRRRGRIDRSIELIRENASKAQHVIYQIRGMLLEADYLRVRDRAAGEELLKKAGELANTRGLSHMLQA